MGMHDGTQNTIKKSESVANIVYGMLYQKIYDKEWNVGDKIPNEFELCERFGASRISVRSAVQRLISMGMLEVRRGDGTYVKSFSLQDYLQQAVPFIVQSEDRHEIAQFREALEAQACQIAIELHNEAEIDELERLFYVSDRAFLNNDVNEYVIADANYHRYLCQMSHNQIIVTMWDAFVKPMSLSIKENVSQLLVSQTNVEDHHLHLVQAIREHDHAEALRLLHIVLYGLT